MPELFRNNKIKSKMPTLTLTFLASGNAAKPS